MLLISFIIPVYNCESHIKECLTSLLQQGLNEEEYELIIINDGSTDNSLKIIKNKSIRFKHIKIIDQSNRGVSYSRNLGIEISQGYYICFIDADDRLIENGFKLIVKDFIYNYNFPEIIKYQMYTVDKFYKKHLDVINEYKVTFWGNIQEYIKKFGITFSTCNQLVSRNLIITNKIKYESILMGEDLLFNLRLYNDNKIQILSTNLNIYRYNVRNNSTVNNIDTQHNLKIFYSLIELYKYLIEYEKSTSYPIEYYEKYKIINRRWIFTRLCASRLSLKKISICIKLIKNYEIFKFKDKNNLLNRFMLFLLSNPFLLYVFSLTYRIFLVIVKPYIKRN